MYAYAESTGPSEQRVSTVLEGRGRRPAAGSEASAGGSCARRTDG